MKVKRIEHIGIAVSCLEEAIPLYQRILGTHCYKVEEVQEQRVRTAFFRVGELKIELLESTDPEGPIGKFIAKRGQGVHHIALAVQGLEQQLESAQAEGLQVIDKTPRRGADDLDIAFLHPKSTLGVLTELCEEK